MPQGEAESLSSLPIACHCTMGGGGSVEIVPQPLQFNVVFVCLFVCFSPNV